MSSSAYCRDDFTCHWSQTGGGLRDFSEVEARTGEEASHIPIVVPGIPGANPEKQIAGSTRLEPGIGLENVDDLGVSSDQLLDTYARQAAMVQPTQVPRIAPDPDDDVVIGTALEAAAEFAVTGDRTLLVVAENEGVRIISVREALSAVEALAERKGY